MVLNTLPRFPKNLIKQTTKDGQTPRTTAEEGTETQKQWFPLPKKIFRKREVSVTNIISEVFKSAETLWRRSILIKAKPTLAQLRKIDFTRFPTNACMYGIPQNIMETGNSINSLLMLFSTYFPSDASKFPFIALNSVPIPSIIPYLILLYLIEFRRNFLSGLRSLRK